MTEKEIKEYVTEIRHKADIFHKSGFATAGFATHFDKSADIIEELLPYMAIGTIEEFKALKEKSVAKKPIKINIPNTSWCRKQERYECPSCHKYLNFRELSYCCVCGQKFDWQ